MSFSLAALEAERDAKLASIKTKLLVDTATNLAVGQLDNVATVLAKHLDLEYRPIFTLIDKGLPEAYHKGALYSIRKTTVAAAVLVISKETKGYNDTTDDQLKLFAANHNHSNIYIYLKDLDRYMTYRQYLETYTPAEMKIDQLIKARFKKNIDRTYLERKAQSFAAAVGWEFSGPISATAPEATLFQATLPYKIRTYDGFKHNLTRFDEGVRVFKDEYILDKPSGHADTTKVSRATLLKKTSGVPIKELIDFSEYLDGILEDIEHHLEPDYIMCECGRPVKTTGNVDGARCIYCDREIPGYYCQDIGLEYSFYEIYNRLKEQKDKGRIFIKAAIKNALK